MVAIVLIHIGLQELCSGILLSPNPLHNLLLAITVRNFGSSTYSSYSTACYNVIIEKSSKLMGRVTWKLAGLILKVVFYHNNVRFMAHSNEIHCVVYY